MMGMLGGGKPSAQWLAVESDGARSVDDILDHGVTGAPDVNAVATHNGDEIDILLWNYHDADVEAPPASCLEGSRSTGSGGDLVETGYMVDHTHSNAYAEWLKMGSPARPDDGQRAALERAAQLDEVIHSHSVRGMKGTAVLTLTLERQAVALIRLRPRQAKP